MEDLKAAGFRAQMFSVDLERGYQNFRLNPLDWKPMCIKKGAHQETSMAFGARSWLSNMQGVSDFIVRIIKVLGRMYLGDLIVGAPHWSIVCKGQELFRELGLLEA